MSRNGVVVEPESKFAATFPGSSSYPNSDGNPLIPGSSKATKPKIVRMKETKFISVFSCWRRKPAGLQGQLRGPSSMQRADRGYDKRSGG